MTPPCPNPFQFDGKETKAKDQVDPNGYYKKKAQSHIQWKQSQTEVLGFIKKMDTGSLAKVASGCMVPGWLRPARDHTCKSISQDT